MSLMTRAVTAFTVLSLAAIPVAALTIKNTSSKDVSVAVDNGTDEKVYQIPAGSSVDVKEDCSSDCAVTGPWGYSRLLSQTDTLETDGGSLVTADATPAQSLIPQNPVTESDDGADASASAAPADSKPAIKRKRTASKPRKQAQKGPASGSFQMLFQGTGK
jgi:hypothetical protein